MTTKIRILPLIAALGVMLTGCGETVKTTSDSTPTANSTSADSSDASDGKPKEEIVLTMAITHTDERYDNELIRAFNEADNGYRIELRNYCESTVDDPDFQGLTPEMGIDSDFRLMQDVINTDDIDIFTAHSFSSSAKLDLLSRKGAFVDLYTFMEDDPDVNRETMNEHILKLNEIDGKLYTLPTKFAIFTVIGDKKYVGDKMNWTIDEFIERWEQMPEGASFNGCHTAEYVYYEVLRGNFEKFIDYETATVHFDDPEFRKMLEFCATFPSCHGQKDEYDSQAPCFVRSMFIPEISGSEYFDSGMTFVGYPTLDGDGAYIKATDGNYAISAKSSPEKQRGAWEFIRSLTTAENLLEDYMVIKEYEFMGKTYKETENKFEGGFPVNNIAFQTYVDDYVNGKYAYMWEPFEGDEFSEAHMVNQGSRESCDKLIAYINSINRLEPGYDSAVWMIINEEVMDYLGGNTDIDRCIELIQNRAAIAVSEQS